MLQKLDFKQPTEEQQKEFMLEMGKAAFLKEPETKIPLVKCEANHVPDQKKDAKKKKNSGLLTGITFLLIAAVFTIISFATGIYTALIGVLLQVVAGISIIINNKEGGK